MFTAPPDLTATASANTIELALRAHPNVFDCAVADRQTEAGSQAIAYVVVGVPCRSQVLLDHLQALVPGTALPAIVQVSSLPLAADGSVDGVVLQALPVIDAAVLEQAEGGLRGIDGVRDAAVLVREVQRARRLLHLSDVLPSTVSIEQRDRPARAAPEAETESPESAGIAALVVGGPLDFPGGSPQTLGASLERAARV